MGNDVVLNLVDIVKVYPNGVVANNECNFCVNESEIHALIGENGAGKSTLMKIIFGIEKPEKGKIILRGEEIKLDSPREAIKHGIGMVHQHFMLVDDLSIAENLVLGDEPSKFKFFTDRKGMLNSVKEFNDRYQFNLDVKKKISDCSVGEKQKVEILKSLMRGAQILILDEPTAVLTPQETVELFLQLKSLKEAGHTIIFISHKLNEIIELCDRVTIMRHGKTVAVRNVSETSVHEISKHMIGRDVNLSITKQPVNRGKSILKTDKLTYFNRDNKKVLDNLNFDLFSGEILGIAGVEGNGQSELAEILAGLKEPHGGSIEIGDKVFKNLTPSLSRMQGVSYIPEDRLKNACAANLSVVENLFAGVIGSRIGTKEYDKRGFLKKKTMVEDTNKAIDDYDIKCDKPEREVKMLSGGNIQKVVVAREINENTKVLIAANPTRGIDARSSSLIRNKLIELRDNGIGVLLISSDLNEILEVSDSVMVMYGGQIYGLFEEASSLTEEELGYYMLGIKKHDRIARRSK